MTNSFLLSLFFLGALILELFYFKYIHLDFTFLKKGRELSLSRRNIILMMAAGFAVFYWAGYQMITGANVFSLQLFYGLIYACSSIITLFLVLPGEKPGLKLVWSTIISVLLLIAIYKIPIQLGQNIYMAVAMLWVAPIVFRQFKINKNLFFVIVIIGMIMDILFVWVLKGDSKITFSDQYMVFNGLVTIGDYYLGIGDFLMGYLLVSAMGLYCSNKVALWLAVLLVLPRFLIRVIFPPLAGMVFPYYLFMVPIFFFVYFLANKKFLCIKD